jgi:hypothetical protein
MHEKYINKREPNQGNRGVSAEANLTSIGLLWPLHENLFSYALNLAFFGEYFGPIDPKA